MNYCDKCDIPDHCEAIGRCFIKDIETDSDEGLITPEDEVREPELKRPKLQSVKKQPLTKEQREFLKEIINY